MKKHDLPAMPFYPGDWFKCPEVRALKLETRMVWFEMLLLMWESTERGYLTLGGKAYPLEPLSRVLGVAPDLLAVCLSEMEAYDVFSRREDGAIYSRRIVRDTDLSEKRAIAGKLGGICSSKKASKSHSKKQASSEDEDEVVIEGEAVNEPYSSKAFHPRKEDFAHIRIDGKPLLWLNVTKWASSVGGDYDLVMKLIYLAVKNGARNVHAYVTALINKHEFDTAQAIKTDVVLAWAYGKKAQKGSKGATQSIGEILKGGV